MWAGKELPGSRKGRQEVAGDALQGDANLWKKQSFDARASLGKPEHVSL